MTDAAIDRDQLARYTAGDPDLEREVLGMFREQVDMWLRLLDPAGDDETWVSAAHSIKGSAAYVGAGALCEACAEAELLVGDGDLKVRRSVAAEKVRAAADAVLAEIAQLDYRAALSSLKTPSPKPSQTSNS